MDCGEIQKLLMGYLDEELEPPLVEEIEAHLADCAECRREERSFRRLA